MEKYARLNFYENINSLIDTYTCSDSKSYWNLKRRLINKSGKSENITCLYDIESNSLVYDEKKVKLTF